MLTEAVILAGGFGTRLQTVVSDVPKPMAPINGHPFLNYMFAYLNHYHIKHVVLSTGYLSEKIIEYYKDEYNGIIISYAHEVTPLGTGGGIRLALEKCHTTDVLVLNGDSFFDVDINAHYKYHHLQKADGTLGLRTVDNAARYGTITLADAGKIKAFKEKDSIDKAGLINGGVYILNKAIYLKNTKPTTAFSIEKDFFETKINELNFVGKEYQTYFIDIGIPEDYNKAQDDFKRFNY